MDITTLSNWLQKESISTNKSLDDLFDPTCYLVSPFNLTKQFLKRKYFLTSQQKDIKTKIGNTFTSNTKATFIALTGSAGTGKTLLTYDIAKEEAKKNKQVLIIHCGQLNNGQYELKDNGFTIIPVRTLKIFGIYDYLKGYDLIIIDEAHRIWDEQLNTIIEAIKNHQKCCIFSYDLKQKIPDRKNNSTLFKKIISEINNLKEYNLTNKIRTNENMADCIKKLFNNKNNHPNKNSHSDIRLNYFDNVDDANSYVESLNTYGWQVLNYTPSRSYTEPHKIYSIPENGPNAHKVLGQEFDNVAVIISENFSYDNNGKLIYKKYSYYGARQMLFQNMARVRKKLNLVIINNPTIFDRCLDILK